MAVKDREARNAYAREWYARNREKHKAAVRRSSKPRIKERREYIRELKRQPCMDCGGTFPPECMDFDHRPGEVKLFEVGIAASKQVSMERLMAEVAKCDLVCANCHRIRTYQRLREGQDG